jgi:hypothetical protein
MESIENPVKNPIDIKAQPSAYLNKVNSAELLKELQKTNKRLQANQNRLQKIVRQYTHIVGNTLFPETLYHLAQKLKKNVEFRQDSLLLYDAYHAEVSIRHQSELLRIKHLTQSPKPFRDLIRQDILRPNRVEMATNIKQILNEALERVTARFLNQNYAKLNAVRERILNQLNVSIEQLRQDFETQLFIENQEALTWIHNHLRPIQLLEFSAAWEQVKLKKNGYTEALLYGYFQELFLNVFKYSDDQPLRLRFYEQNRNKVTYLVSSWENTYLNNTTISSGNGLEGIREDLRMLNDSDEHAKTLQIIDNNAHFRVILCLRKDLLIFEPSTKKYARLQ